MSNIITLEQHKRLEIFDGLFPMRFRTTAFNFILNSKFMIGWSDTIVPENKSHDYFLHSCFSEADVSHLGIMQYITASPVNNLIQNLKLEQCIVNLSTPSDVNHIHTHYYKLVLLYYVNLEWRNGWYGETQFYSEDNKSVQFTSPYTPGRLIAFDGTIPHAIRPQSIIGPQYRFTMAMIFN